MNNQPNYRDLQEKIDQIIGKIGLEKMLKLLDNFINNTTTISQHGGKEKLIVEYLKQITITVFDLDESQFLGSKVLEYKEARMVAYTLLRNHCNISHAKIGVYFNTTKYSVLYFRAKCEDMLSIPQFHRSFIIKYNEIEENFIQFLGNPHF
ncbi:hypothetical protein ATO12_12605 [Aquimarina atlantica]|uniref:Chromosomal replication initiator DnaA C-terminal domain-containing protein n=1 Tax=Aquimarina atlantica TaxID=1317122 RepID=A0A023BX30_9FLAO|nr:hypothetical protein [Aquimarina atlantica]EZH74601.1 hypothetical protein ATO12_12605 [Aquimarina atlantica]